MKNILKLISLLLIIQSLYSFRIQGTWTVSEIKNFPILQQLVSIQIEDVIFKNQEVQQKLTIIGGCKTYSYELQVIDNNLFIKYQTLKQIEQNSNNNNNKSSCAFAVLSMHSAIQSKLNQVFYFQLFGNYLVFLNPKNQILFKFQRDQSQKINNLRGNWNLFRINSVSSSQSVQIVDAQMTFCQGKLSFGYILSEKYGIKTRLINNDGCKQQNLQQTVLSSNFYRRVGGILEIYNANVELIMELKYTNEIDLNMLQQKKQQQIKKAQQLQKKAQNSQSNMNPTSNQIPTTVKLTSTIDDFVGRWLPISVFGIPIKSTPIYFIFNTNQISYNGGCSVYQFKYSVDMTAKTMTIGQNKSTINKCQVDDDGFYINAVNKISKYSITAIGNQINLVITDDKGNNVFQLYKIVDTTSSTNITIPISSNNNENKLVPAVQKQKLLDAGKYVFLLLKRRDLPRKFCTIAGNKISYEGCNTIQHTYKILNNNQIQITGKILTNKQCANNNDQVMFNTFNSITKYEAGVESGSLILKDSSNVELINLSLF